ncbi:MAG: helix-turn-helix domain-containing protein [Defluviitaleaceae bacterium]|nr:helix-turn-helix domain-containing protein [Defluviitaleaceae bacterium]
MKINSAEIIKTMRKEMGLSQEELAEQLFISVRQLARIECGEATMDIWQFISTLELMGHPTEDYWLLYLNSDEYGSYRDYKRLKRQLNNGDLTEIKEVVDAIEKGPLIKQPIIRQFITYVNAVIGKTEPSAQIIDALLTAMRMSKPHFEEKMISEYRMTYNEMSITITMAECLSGMEEHDRCISMVQSMINSRENARVSDEDKTILFPSLYFALSRMLKRAGKLKEALRACDIAVDICREYNNLKNIPDMLFHMADCYHKLGEEEHIYKTHLVRAYHAAYAMGKVKIAAIIKEDALKYFNVTVP